MTSILFEVAWRADALSKLSSLPTWNAIALFFAFEDAEEDCVVVALDRSFLGDKGRRDFNSVIRENIQNGAHTENVLCEDVPFLTNARLAIQNNHIRLHHLSVTQCEYDPLFTKGMYTWL